MYLTIDVETNGLYGKTFAFGAVLTQADGTVTGEWLRGYRPDWVMNENGGYALDHFVADKVIPALNTAERWINCGGMDDLCYEFFQIWTSSAMMCSGDERLYICADVAYPCETTFLHDVHNRFPDLMVYPLVDISSMLLAHGYDPLESYYRMDPEEMPAHNPLADARQSSRILHTLLRGDSLIFAERAGN